MHKDAGRWIARWTGTNRIARDGAQLRALPVLTMIRPLDKRR
jgi:hypothetical protein